MRAEGPRVALRTLGCKVNRSESEALAEALETLGVTLTETEADADAVVVNTCSVTGEADAKARKEIRRALAATAGPVVVTGCLAAIDRDGLRSLDSRVLVADDRSSVAQEVATLVGAPCLRGVDPQAGMAGGSTGARHRTRALVKVQDGCDNRCAYCIVPDARGVPRSVPAEDVVARVAGLHASGTAEVVLTGVNIGTYGAEGASDLAALVRLVAATGIRRIRISSIEPPDLTSRLLEVLASLPAVAPHLHVPLQSGSDRTLVAMGRRYDSASYARCLSRARDALPGLAVTTDVIAGFPGETDGDFAVSVAFIETCGFAKLHVFRYSRRSGTPAATAPGQVAPAVKALRARTLREMSVRFERTHADARAGGPAMLLVEAVRDGCARGTTEDYLRVSAELPGARTGDLVPVVLGRTAEGAPRGYYVDERHA